MRRLRAMRRSSGGNKLYLCCKEINCVVDVALESDVDDDGENVLRLWRMLCGI